jgi:hypothetical protein
MLAVGALYLKTQTCMCFLPSIRPQFWQFCFEYHIAWAQPPDRT